MQDPHQDNTTKIYDLGAEEYKKSTQDFEFPDKIFEYFLEQLPGKKVLDIGCGFGRDIYRMRKLGYEASGIEISQKLIDLARADIKKYIVWDDMNNIEKYVSPKNLDGIFSAASLVHMDKNIAQNILKKSYTLLKNKGLIFVGVKISDTPTVTMKESFSISGVMKKYAYYTQSELTNILENIGFTIQKINKNSYKNDSWMIIIANK